MIVVDIKIGQNGCIRSLKSNGHADFANRGKDIVCAAVSILIRTMARLISDNNNICFKGNAGKRGRIIFSLENLDESNTEYIKGCTDFLIKGLNDLKQEFPDAIKIKMGRYKDGT